ncbi:hypothetical protein CR513_44389, partial [Mucuna pruriens]
MTQLRRSRHQANQYEFIRLHIHRFHLEKNSQRLIRLAILDITRYQSRPGNNILRPRMIKQEPRGHHVTRLGIPINHGGERNNILLRHSIKHASGAGHIPYLHKTQHHGVPRRHISVRHFIKHLLGLHNISKGSIANKQSSPRNHIPLRHSIKHPASINNSITLAIHVNQTGGHVEILVHAAPERGPMKRLRVGAGIGKRPMRLLHEKEGGEGMGKETVLAVGINEGVPEEGGRGENAAKDGDRVGEGMNAGNEKGNEEVVLLEASVDYAGMDLFEMFTALAGLQEGADARSCTTTTPLTD